MIPIDFRAAVTAMKRLTLAGLLVYTGVACSSWTGDTPSEKAEPLVERENIASLRLDGVRDFVDLGTVAAGDPLQLAGEPFTLAAWFYQEKGGDPYQRIIDKSDGAYGQNGWGLGADADSGMIHFYVHDGEQGADFASRRGLFQTEQWHFVVAVARRDRLEIWLDGRLDEGSWYEAGAHVLPADATTGLRLGTWNHDEGREWKGWLDEVSVWNVALEGEAIAALAEARGRVDLTRNAGAYQAAENLLGWWRMGSGAKLLADPTAIPRSIHDRSEGGREGALRPAQGPQPDVGMVP